MVETADTIPQAAQVRPKMKMSMPIARAIDKVAEARDAFRMSTMPARWIAMLQQILEESEEMFE